MLLAAAAPAVEPEAEPVVSPMALVAVLPLTVPVEVEPNWETAGLLTWALLTIVCVAVPIEFAAPLTISV